MTEPAEPGFIDRLRARFGWFDHVMRAQERYQRAKGDFYAAGITYFTIYRHEGALAAGTPAPLTGPASIGEFHDRFVRTPEGWRLRLRTTQVAFRR